MKIRKLYIVIIAVFVILLMFVITHDLWLDSIAKFLVVNEELSPADVIVILGGGGQESENCALGATPSSLLIPSCSCWSGLIPWVSGIRWALA